VISSLHLKVGHSLTVLVGIHPKTGQKFGIAATFHERFPHVKPWLKATYVQPLEVGRTYSIQLIENNRRIYHLVTKPMYYSKPTYETMAKCLSDLRKQVLDHGVKQLAIPMLGAGLDRLGWYRVRQLIQATFQDDDIHVVVCIKPS
jgi:O-acetyl-ADP-ribose deacetylase (regulator of RNase III)